MKISQSKIEQLENCLREYCRPLYERLLPAMSQKQIDSYFKLWKVDDENLLKIFHWKNGIAYDHIYPTHSFDYTGFGVIPTLEYINEVKTSQIDKLWRTSLFPLILSFGGDFLLYETDKQSSNYGQLFLYSPSLGYVDYQPGYFDSIETLIDTLCENFKRGIFKYDTQNMSLEINFEMLIKTSRQFNPKSEYWEG